MIIENGKEVKAPVYNRIIGDPELISSDIVFKGKGNILYAEENVRLKKSRITFRSDDALVYLSSCGKHPYKLKIDAWRGTTCYFGKDNYYNNTLNVILSERQSLVVGGGGVFSFGIWIRTADPHILYDIESGKRINMARSVLIGDHVWLGQNALILKGTKIGSGSVIAAGSVLAGRDVPSNTVAAGDPAGIVHEGVFFTGESTHDFTDEQTEQSMTCERRDFIYNETGAMDFGEIAEKLTKEPDAAGRLDIVRDLLAGEHGKNRFFIG